MGYALACGRSRPRNSTGSRMQIVAQSGVGHRRSAAASNNRDILGSDIARGISGQEFFLAYQPKFSIGPGDGNHSLSGVEALIRWNHPQLGLLLQGQFLGAVESAGLDGELAAFVLRTAAKQIRTWLDTLGWTPHVAINLSAAQLSSPDLCDTVLDALRRSDAEARSLTVEITETAGIRDVAVTARQLQALRDAGVQVSIDDFGTGFASFHYLLQFPFDSIKICPEFVQGIGRGTGADEICRSIIQLGHSLTKRVIAEGAETEQQLKFLRRHHCHDVQGFLLGHPTSGEVFSRRFIDAIAPACSDAVVACVSRH